MFDRKRPVCPPVSKKESPPKCKRAFHSASTYLSGGLLCQVCRRNVVVEPLPVSATLSDRHRIAPQFGACVQCQLHELFTHHLVVKFNRVRLPFITTVLGIFLEQKPDCPQNWIDKSTRHVVRGLFEISGHFRSIEQRPLRFAILVPDFLQCPGASTQFLDEVGKTAFHMVVELKNLLCNRRKTFIAFRSFKVDLERPPL